MVEKNKKIALVGYMAAGKSTLAKQLGRALGLPADDLDSMLEAKLGMGISEYLSPKTEIEFRKMERETLLEWFEKDEKGILATGGGTPCYYDNMDELLRNSLVVFIDLPVKKLVERLKNESASRPLLDGVQNLPTYVGAHLFERRPFYDRAHIVFFPERETFDDLIAKIDTFVK